MKVPLGNLPNSFDICSPDKRYRTQYHPFAIIIKKLCLVHWSQQPAGEEVGAVFTILKHLYSEKISAAKTISS